MCKIMVCFNLHALHNLSQPATKAECDGVQELVQAIKEAWKRAKDKEERGEENTVYTKMDGDRLRSAGLALVRFLEKKDSEFKPGAWYKNSKFLTIINFDNFERKIQEVQKQVDGFIWVSWKVQATRTTRRWQTFSGKFGIRCPFNTHL